MFINLFYSMVLFHKIINKKTLLFLFFQKKKIIINVSIIVFYIKLFYIYFF